MKAALAKKPLIRIAVVGTDPLQFVGFRAAFHPERDFELTSSSLLDIGMQQNIDLVLLGDRSSQNVFDVMATLKATRPNLRIIVIGSGMVEFPKRIVRLATQAIQEGHRLGFHVMGRFQGPRELRTDSSHQRSSLSRRAGSPPQVGPEWVRPHGKGIRPGLAIAPANRQYLSDPEPG